MMNRGIPLALAIALLMLFSCSNDRPEDLIPKDTFIDLLVEFELLRSVQRIEGDSLQTARYTEAVMSEYGITFDQFERSNLHYMEDPESYRNLYREAVERLNMEIGRLRAAE
jgi:hypothetical protein